MERAGRIVSKGLKVMEIAGVKSYHLAPRAWSAAVGKKIADHCRPVFLDGKKLIVEVEDGVWQTQMRSLSRSVLERIARVIGDGVVTELEFRVAPQRRQPAVAQSPASTDEAERITDPVMRRVYQTARRKAKQA